MGNLHDFGFGSDFMDMTPKCTHTHIQVGIPKAEKTSTQQRK